MNHLLSREEKIKRLKDGFGITVYEGKEYLMLHNAFLDHHLRFDEACYSAYAICLTDPLDSDGEQPLYIIKWDILEPYDPYAQAEDEACDWKKPSKVYPCGYTDLEEVDI